MADSPPLRAVPDPDDPGPTDRLDPADLALVERALADLDHLRPTDAPRGGLGDDAEPMPDWVWSRLHDSLAMAADPAPRAGRTTRWTGGLVAAGVAVIAVGIAVTVLRTGGTAVVATDANLGSAAEVAKLAVPAATTFAAAEDSAAQAAAPPSASAPAGTGAGTADSTPARPAARMVLDSRTDYRPETLPGQVVSLVKNAGFTTLRDAVSKQMPTPAMPVEDGFTASWQQLRDCVTRLTQSDRSQALVVDRGTYAGAAAGVVVAPADLLSEDTTAEPGASDPASPAPTVSLATPLGTFDVWVVDPECEQVAANLDDFALYAWQS